MDAVSTDYTEWIESNYPTQTIAKNRCNEAVRNMISKFPELKLCVGKVNGVFHCWCEYQGEIVDPTRKQFGDVELNYCFIANRFLDRDEVELSTGIVFLRDEDDY